MASSTTSAVISREQDDNVKAIAADEKELTLLEKKLELLQDGSMEKMLLEMKLDAKKENIKTKKFMLSMMRQHKINSDTVTSLKDECSALKKGIEGVAGVQDSQQESVKQVNDEITKVCEELSILTGLVQRQAMKINHLQEHNEAKEGRNMRQNLVIQGLEYGKEDNEESIKEIVTNFFSQTMKIRKNIAIQLILRSGSEEHLALVISLQNLKDKGVIFKNVKNIIGIKNNANNSYFVSDQLTFEKQEEQRRY